MRKTAMTEDASIRNAKAERRHVRIGQDGSEDAKLHQPARNHAAAERETDCERNCGM